MVEVGYFKSGNNELSFSCEIPSEKTRKVGIIFVHAADGNRLGPHRMFVEFAESFSSLGYPILRFDLSGCGDSTGSASQDNTAPDISDVVEAIRFFIAKEHLDGVILFGISRGARVGYAAMAQYVLPLKGMILLSTPVSSNKAALKSFRIRLKEYIFKLRDPKHLWKLLSGRANIPQIWQTLKTALGLRHRYTQAEKNGLASRCPILFVYGSGDSLTEESSRYYTIKCKENEVPYDCHFIADANHSFFHYKWKEEILCVSKQWLDRIVN